MQKLGKKLKNVPMDTSQVHSSTSSSLNRVQRLSEKNICCSHNNPEVNQPQCKEGQNLRVSVKVYILNMRGNPLMPCSSRKAKILLR
jgi:hypothetical protein